MGPMGKDIDRNNRAHINLFLRYESLMKMLAIKMENMPTQFLAYP